MDNDINLQYFHGFCCNFNSFDLLPCVGFNIFRKFKLQCGIFANVSNVFTKLTHNFASFCLFWLHVCKLGVVIPRCKMLFLFANALCYSWQLVAKPHTISTTWATCETMVKVLSLVVTSYVLIKVMGIDSLEMAFDSLVLPIMNYVMNLQIKLFLIVGWFGGECFWCKVGGFDSLYKTPCFGSTYIWNHFFLHGFDRK